MRFAKALAALHLAAVFVLAPPGASAHHSYAMFDSSSTRTDVGTDAKHERKNPQVLHWVYVPKPGPSGGHDLWAFENGSPTGLSARGWTRESFKAGEKVTIDYWPLRDGAKGGHFERATWADGRKLAGAGGPGRF